MENRGQNLSTEEDMASVLAQLGTLKDTNPEVFLKLLESLGISSENELLNDKEGALTKMTESIMQMRGESKGLGDDDKGIKLTKDKTQPKGITITPTAGFAFKTVLLSAPGANSQLQQQLKQTAGSSVAILDDKDKLQKVFINFTQHEEISAPGMKKKLNEEGEEVEGMNIPMSVGPLHFDVDNKGRSCHVYDITVNPIVITEAGSDVTGKYRDFICNLGIQCIENKYKLALDKRYKLPKLKYFGKNIESQYIQDRKNMPSIVEVSSKTNNKSGSSAADKKAKADAAKAAAAAKDNKFSVADVELKYCVFWLHSNHNGSSADVNGSNTDANNCSESSWDSCEKTPYISSNSTASSANNTSVLSEYVDPVHSLSSIASAAATAATAVDDKAQDVRGLLVIADIPAANAMELITQLNDNNTATSTTARNTVIQTSPYKLLVKLPGYKKSVMYLPHSVLPAEVVTSLHYPPNGAIHTVEVHIVLPLDRADYALQPDAGSKPWLVSQALSSDGDHSSQSHSASHSQLSSSNPFSSVHNNANSNNSQSASKVKSASNMGDRLNQDENVVYPEDRFHLKLPEDVDQYTGLKMDPARSEKEMIEAMDGKVELKPHHNEDKADEEEVEEEEVLAEDRFHAKDASSSYLIHQREQAKKDKWDKYNKEKAERANDPNVEYVDMDDFRAGGKYGAETSKESKQLAALANSSDSTTVTTSTTSSERDREELRKAAVIVATSQKLELGGDGGVSLSSNLWSELL